MSDEKKFLDDNEWIEADLAKEVEEVEEVEEAPKKGLVWGRDKGTGRLVRVSVDE